MRYWQCTIRYTGNGSGSIDNLEPSPKIKDLWKLLIHVKMLDGRKHKDKKIRASSSRKREYHRYTVWHIIRRKIMDIEPHS